jgi:hypothetical protein
MFASFYLFYSNLIECTVCMSMHLIYSFIAISQYEHANPELVHFYLLKDHTHWKVPERRVAKFVKKQRKAADGTAAGTAGDQDDASEMSVATASSVSKRYKSIAKGVGRLLHIGSRSKKKDDKESALDHPPVVSLLGQARSLDCVSEVHEDDPLDPLLLPSPVHIFKDDTKEESDDNEDFMTAVQEEVKEDGKGEVKGRALVFEDDNDGKKQGGICEPCEGCNIL